MSNFEYECSLTGVTEPAIDIQSPQSEDDMDGMGDCPPGWTKIHITRRRFNPKWLLIQQIKEGMVEQVVSRYPDHVREAQRVAVTLQIDAQFHAMEADTPMFVLDVDESVFISGSADATTEFNEIRAKLELDALHHAEDDEMEEEADDQTGEAEEEGEEK